MPSCARPLTRFSSARLSSSWRRSRPWRPQNADTDDRWIGQIRLDDLVRHEIENTRTTARAVRRSASGISAVGPAAPAPTSSCASTDNRQFAYVSGLPSSGAACSESTENLLRRPRYSRWRRCDIELTVPSAVTSTSAGFNASMRSSSSVSARRSAFSSAESGPVIFAREVPARPFEPRARPCRGSRVARRPRNRVVAFASRRASRLTLPTPQPFRRKFNEGRSLL